MKSYQQYCGLAKSLDVIGDRWSPLIIRELAIRDCRYTDVRDGLPGIASNLLAQRLRDLVEAGVAERFDAPPPVAAPLYRLTSRGHDLLPALFSLVRWAQPAMVSGPGSAEHERARWTAFAALAFIRDVPSDVGSLTALFAHPVEPVLLIVSGGVLRASVRAGWSMDSEPVDIVVAGAVWHQLGLLCGEISFSDATTLLEIGGKRDALRRFRRLIAANTSVPASRAGVLG